MKTNKYISSKQYPYLPKGKTYQYIPSSNAYIKRAKEITKFLRKKNPNAVVTGSVIVKENKIISEGINSPLHDSFCPRTAFEYPSGHGYDVCPNHCHPVNHSEAQAIKHAKEKNISTYGADLYLYGHWWCCKMCWDAMLAVDIKNVYLIEGATELFFAPISGKIEPNKNLTYYAAAGMTRTKTQKPLLFHEQAGKLLNRVNISGYFPWHHTDPIKNPNVTPKEVYKKNSNAIKNSNFVLAHLGEPSLGVGIEIELASLHKTPVIGFAPKGARVSRMALGAPSMKSFFFFDDIKDFIMKLSEALKNN